MTMIFESKTQISLSIDKLTTTQLKFHNLFLAWELVNLQKWITFIFFYIYLIDKIF